MDIDALYSIMSTCVCTFRKGDPVVRFEENGVATVIYTDMPHISDAPDFRPTKLIDVYFFWVAIDEEKATPFKSAFYHAVKSAAGMLQRGPSYIAIGGEMGDQTAGLCAMALGQYFGFWRVVTPSMLGLEGKRAEHAAGLGYVMISGFKEQEDNERDAGRTPVGA